MTPTATRAPFEAARAALERHFGYPAFRAPQERVVRSVLAGVDTLAVLPTGAGKSVCFQIPAVVLPGITVVISPLLALMEDQVSAARRRGIPARALNSLESPTDRRRTLAEVARGEVKLLYVAPERAARVVEELSEAGASVDLLAVDEAHCIAEWGPDFRPAYLTLGRFRQALGHPPAVALTGSATPEVRDTIVRVLGLGTRGGCDRHLASFDRRNLWFGVERVPDDRGRLRRLLELLTSEGRRGIVYAPTRNLTEALARILRERGFRARPYHAGLSKERRGRLLQAFLDDTVDVVTATCAFGMGIDKPDVRLVVHWSMPPTPESYYQEAGRAGRDGAPSRCVLLYHPSDGDLPRQELLVTFPPRPVIEEAWRQPDGLERLPANVAASVRRLREELRPERGPVRWDRIDRRRAAALDRIRAVERYASGGRCRRAELLGYFGERLIRCSGCDRCRR